MLPPFRSIVRNHPFYFGGVGVANQYRLGQLVFALLPFRGQDVAQMRMPPLHLSGGGFLEALGGALVCFQFWHRNPVLSCRFSVLSCKHSAISSEHSATKQTLSPIFAWN